jgi:iron(III) transport system ATP-binding protein
LVTVRLENVIKRYGELVAVEGLSLEVKAGELFFFLGPSGCGKTTILRLIAGFLQPDQGEIYFDGRAMAAVPAHRRNAGMVFQNYALWPHLTVQENVAYGLEVRKIKGQERKRRVKEALEMVRMGEFGKRLPSELSGGQQQRVALARALVVEPDVVLLDEPLSNLDAKLRLEMRTEIKRVHRQTGITTLYVTHDQKEALSMAQRVAVMSMGRVEQVGEPHEIYRHPENEFVADFLGEANFFPGRILEISSEGALLETSLGNFLCGSPPSGLTKGARVLLSIRPEAISINSDSNGPNRFEAHLAEATYLGEVAQYTFRAQGLEIKASALNPAGQMLTPGDKALLSFRPKDLILFEKSP